MKTRYKFLHTGLKSAHQDFTWEIGKWYKTEGELDICNNGFHCSKEIGQAFSYIPGEILAVVEVKGKSVAQDDKDCWEEMRIVKVWNWEKKNSVAIAIYSAELCLDVFEKQYPDDKRPREAIEAAVAWMENPTKGNEAAAEATVWAAEAAAEAAAWAAEAAAWAAEAAAEAAAWAAEAAAWAAEAAAWAAEAAEGTTVWAAAEEAVTKKIYKRFDEELKILTPYGN